MKVFDVPELHALPDPAPYDLNPVQFAHFVFTAMLKHEAATLTARVHPGSGDAAVVWYVAEKIGCHGGQPVAVAALPSAGWFRSVLARIAVGYMDSQLYGGQTTCLLQQRGKTFICSLKMSNMGRTGFWLEMESRLAPEELW